MFTIPRERDDTKSINWKTLNCKRLAEIPLFDPDHPHKLDHKDIVQGNIGSCWFLAVLISYLRPNSKNIEDRANDFYNSISVFRQDYNRTIYKVKIDHKNVYVDDYIASTYIDEIHKRKVIRCIWPILFEKAMLSIMTARMDEKDSLIKTYGDEVFVGDINNKYGEMKAAVIGIRYLISSKSQVYCLHIKDVNPRLPQIQALDIYRRFKAGNHVMANTARFTYPGRKLHGKMPIKEAGATPAHCYAVIDMKYSKELGTYLLTIQNPWGINEIGETRSKFVYPDWAEPGEGISILTWERFHYLFACVHMTK